MNDKCGTCHNFSWHGSVAIFSFPQCEIFPETAGVGLRAVGVGPAAGTVFDLNIGERTKILIRIILSVTNYLQFKYNLLTRVVLSYGVMTG